MERKLLRLAAAYFFPFIHPNRRKNGELKGGNQTGSGSAVSWSIRSGLSLAIQRERKKMRRERNVMNKRMEAKARCVSV